MTKVVIADLSLIGSKKSDSVREMRVWNSKGEIVRINWLDANSPTFIDDLTWVFRKNVKKARQENKRLFGSPDGFNTKKRRQPMQNTSSPA
jgi:hypothetical protein